MAIPQREKVITALAGEFLVAGKLCVMGYLAFLTLKNYPDIDIFVLNPKTDEHVAIQVKTTRGHDRYSVPERIDTLKQHFVFVQIKKDNTADYFVLSSKDVAKISQAEREEYIKTHEGVKQEQPRMISIKGLTKFKDNWKSLGLD